MWDTQISNLYKPAVFGFAQQNSDMEHDYLNERYDAICNQMNKVLMDDL